MNPAERIILGLDRALRTVCSVQSAVRPSPGRAHTTNDMDAAATRLAAGLMRINHAGEVAAQALYEGQAATARLEAVRDAMSQAAAEEADHLAWCHERLQELDSRPSLLNPLWYAGSWTLGALAGLAGDRWSLGFVAETEKQVVCHLEDHLTRLPPGDNRSRAILEQMKVDEAHHGTAAIEAGGAELPAPVRAAMQAASKVMTTIAFRV